MIEPRTVITRKDQAFAIEIGDELVIMHIAFGNCITIN